MTKEEQFEVFEKNIFNLMERYPTELNGEEFKIAVKNLVQEYVEQQGAYEEGVKAVLSSFLTGYGNELMENGDLDRGMKFIRFGSNLLPNMYGDEVTLYLRSTQYYIEKGDVEKGIRFLKKLCCETASNYVESIEFRGLTHVWEKYCHLVAGQVPDSIVTLGKREPVPPEKCTKQIGDILKLPKENMMMELEDHLYEMSAYGDAVGVLNKWERIVYDANEVLTRVNSDGVVDFLFANGHRMKQTKKAMETIGALKSIEFLELVESEFLKGKVPKTQESVENTIHRMWDKDEEVFEEAELYFEEEDITLELEERIYEFIEANKNRFR